MGVFWENVVAITLVFTFCGSITSFRALPCKDFASHLTNVCRRTHSGWDHCELWPILLSGSFNVFLDEELATSIAVLQLVRLPVPGAFARQLVTIAHICACRFPGLARALYKQLGTHCTRACSKQCECNVSFNGTRAHQEEGLGCTTEVCSG